MKRRIVCVIQRVWPYPAAPDEMRVGGSQIHHAWSCKCGRHGDGYETLDKARAAADKHIAISQTETA